MFEGGNPIHRQPRHHIPKYCQYHSIKAETLNRLILGINKEAMGYDGACNLKIEIDWMVD